MAGFCGLTVADIRPESLNAVARCGRMRPPARIVLFPFVQVALLPIVFDTTHARLSWRAHPICGNLTF